MCPFGFFEALMELPPLEQLVGSTRERDALVAYASLEYGQSPVLFLCALFDFKVGTPSLADARHIFDKYLADSAPHPIAVSSSVRKNIAKKLKSAKADVLVFQVRSPLRIASRRRLAGFVFRIFRFLIFFPLFCDASAEMEPVHRRIEIWNPFGKKRRPSSQRRRFF